MHLDQARIGSKPRFVASIGYKRGIAKHARDQNTIQTMQAIMLENQVRERFLSKVPSERQERAALWADCWVKRVVALQHAGGGEMALLAFQHASTHQIVNGLVSPSLALSP